MAMRFTIDLCNDLGDSLLLREVASSFSAPPSFPPSSAESNQPG